MRDLDKKVSIEMSIGDFSYVGMLLMEAHRSGDWDEKANGITRKFLNKFYNQIIEKASPEGVLAELDVMLLLKKVNEENKAQ